MHGAPVLVVAANILSRRINPAERGSCILFADAAGAVVRGAFRPARRRRPGCQARRRRQRLRAHQIAAGGSRRPFAADLRDRRNADDHRRRPGRVHPRRRHDGRHRRGRRSPKRSSPSPTSTVSFRIKRTDASSPPSPSSLACRPRRSSPPLPSSATARRRRSHCRSRLPLSKGAFSGAIACSCARQAPD